MSILFFCAIITQVRFMPFKTKVKKEKSSERFAAYVAGAKVSYGQSSAEKQTKITDFVPSRHSGKTLEKPPVGAQIVKITILAFLVIGLQIILKVSHIGL